MNIKNKIVSDGEFGNMKQNLICKSGNLIFFIFYYISVKQKSEWGNVIGISAGGRKSD